LDFQILSTFLPAKYKGIHQHLVAYIVTNSKKKHHAFYSALRNYGFSVKERYMAWSKSNTIMKTDWDVGITIDALDQIDSYDTFALASGDGDFTQLLRYLKAKGKRTIVLTFEHSASKSLYSVADELFILTEDVVYNVG